MSQTYERLTDKLIAFIGRQKLFFTATAPLSGEGRVNVSPKGYDSLAVLDDRTLAYLDLGGSGIETQAHVQENGRITLMWCAFEGAADIVRVYGRGEAVPLHDPRFPALLTPLPRLRPRGARSSWCTWRARPTAAAGACRFFDYKGERDQLRRWVDAKPYDGVVRDPLRQERPLDRRPARPRAPRRRNDRPVTAPRAQFVNIGERTNVTGSAKFKTLVVAGDYPPALVGRAPAGGGRRPGHRHQHG